MMRLLDPEPLQAAAESPFSDDLCDLRTKTAREDVVLERHDSGRLLQQFHEVRQRGRCEARGNRNPNGDAARSEQRLCAHCLVGNRSKGEQQEVAGSDDLQPRRIERSRQCVKNACILGEPEVRRPRLIVQRAHGVGCITVIRRRDHAHVRQRPHQGDVLNRMVGDPCRPISETAAHCDDAHLELVQMRAVAHLLEGTERCEGRDGVAVRPESLERESGCDTEHVRLGDANVDEARRMRVGEFLDDHESQVTGQQHQTRVGAGELGQLVDDCFSHAAAASSRRAR